jgi:mRNA interferase RelE/StbE
VRQISYTASATKGLVRLPEDVRKRLVAKLNRYAEGQGGVVRKLAGRPNLRLRVGDYRLIFDETPTTITVVAVGHRRDIYR